MWVCKVVCCLCMLAMQYTVNLSGVYPASHPMSAGIASSSPHDPQRLSTATDTDEAWL